MRLLSKRGSALIQAMLVTGMVASVAGIYAGQYRDAGRTGALARARAQMMMVEGRVRYMAVHPTTYVCTMDNLTQLRTCQINTGLLKAQALNMPGIPCQPGVPVPCGIRVQNINNPGNAGAPADIAAVPNAGPNKGQVYAEIVYTGADVNVASVKITDLFIPMDLGSLAALCPVATPVFQGLDAAGNLLCKALPKCASPNSVVLGLNPQNMQLSCAPLNTNTLACPAGQIIKNIYWDVTVNGYAVTCMPQLDAFAYNQFAPRLENLNHVVPPYDSGASPPASTTTTIPPTTTSLTVTTLPGPTTTTLAAGSCNVGHPMGWTTTHGMAYANCAEYYNPPPGTFTYTVMNNGDSTLLNANYANGVDGTGTSFNQGYGQATITCVNGSIVLSATSCNLGLPP